MDAYIMALEKSNSFDRSNHLAGYLPEIADLSPEQENSFMRAFNGNRQVFGAFEFTANVVEHLKRLTGHDYEIIDLRLYRNGLPF